MTKKRNNIGVNTVDFLRGCFHKNPNDYSDLEVCQMLNLLYVGNIGENSLDAKTIISIGKNITKQNEPSWEELKKAVADKNANHIVKEIKKKWSNPKDEITQYYNEAANIGNFDGLILGENPPPDSHLLIDNEGPYYGAIFKAIDRPNSISKGLNEKKILFLDILKLPIPIGRALRKNWSCHFKLKYKKQLVYMSTALMQISLEPYQKQIRPRIPLAIMIPPLTSDGIYEDALENKTGHLKESILSKNNLDEEKFLYKQKKGGNDFKSKTIFRANTPDEKLLRNALGIKNK
jgi:hypothetical protein